MTAIDAVAASAPRYQEVMIACAELVLDGCLRVPPDPVGDVVYAHGGGADRHSPRHRYMVEVLARHGLATLTVDVLTPAEAGRPGSLFDVELLGETSQSGRARLLGLDEPFFGGRTLGHLGPNTRILFRRIPTKRSCLASDVGGTFGTRAMRPCGWFQRRVNWSAAVLITTGGSGRRR